MKSEKSNKINKKSSEFSELLSSYSTDFSLLYQHFQRLTFRIMKKDPSSCSYLFKTTIKKSRKNFNHERK